MVQKIDSDALVSITRINPDTGKTRSFVLPLHQVKEAIESSGVDDLIWEDGAKFDLYFGVSTLKEVPPTGKRGGLKNVDRVPGVWADLDVKPGGFETEAEILALLDKVPIEPTAIVLTGSGGVHAYWRFTTPVHCELGGKLSLMWWSLLSELAAPVGIDRLCDPSRILRIPGTLRWPKKTDPPPFEAKLCSLMLSRDVSVL